MLIIATNRLTVIVYCYFCINTILAVTESDEGRTGLFKISEHKKCLEKEKAFLVYNAASLEMCVKDCGRRGNCAALNYRRQSSLCELFNSEDGDLVLNLQKQKLGSCVHVRKSDIYFTDDQPLCSCEDSERMCDARNSFCRVPVCLKPDLLNGEIFGDMTVFGARIEYTCKAGYVEISGHTYSTCQADGKWSHEPSCTRVCPNVQLNHGSLTNAINNVVGTRLEYSCNADYIEAEGHTYSLCQADGTWTYEPNCIKDCREPASHPDSAVSPGPTTEGTTRKYSCSDFFMTSIDSTKTDTTCESNGQWTAADFRCVLDYEYIGCFENYDENRVLTHEFQDDEMTPELCVRACFSKGNIYAAPEARDHCFCGNQLAHNNKVSESDCNLGCSGNNKLTCGAGFRASVFKNDEGNQYLGCYRDGQDRILTGLSIYSDMQMTTQKCLQICHGHKYAGTEFAKQCFCGDEVLKVDKRVDNKCNMLCSGNKNQFCGGLGHMSLYMTEP